ncbi:MAG: NrsF family protein [Parvibaculum sp.]|uniref:NrsF family protein n=1 Tax=Parvibaculum sp. TaxID=2024848 RepID=UPI00272FE526|nr:NrsF family protein [Parvibaculum sp.]MDP2150273.1 NrsF family protein [Parvibaculum sp.]
MKTEELIGSLASDVMPVRRLLLPPFRMVIWLGLSLPWIVLVVWYMGVRPDLMSRLGDGTWLAEQSLALMTALTAALAALCVSVPGRPLWERLLPLLPLGLWVGTIVQGCIQSIMAGGPWTSLIRMDWSCTPHIALLGIGPAVVMIALVRKGAPVAPYVTIGYAALAATALAAFGLRFFHAEDASLMILVWQLGSVALLTAACTLFAERLFPWRVVAPR